jgi:hypothetical protein
LASFRNLQIILICSGFSSSEIVEVSLFSRKIFPGDASLALVARNRPHLEDISICIVKPYTSCARADDSSPVRARDMHRMPSGTAILGCVAPLTRETQALVTPAPSSPTW